MRRKRCEDMTMHHYTASRLHWPVLIALLLMVCAPLLLYLRPGFLVMLSDMLWACF
jgi:hypothetical protein